MASPNSLARLTRGDEMQFFLQLQEAGYTPEQILKLNQHPEVLATMRATMVEHPVFRLIHGRFTPLAEVLEAVKRYPSVTEADIALALEEAQRSGRLARYEEASPKNPLLTPVVTVYRATVPETLCYARDRMAEAFGDTFAQWEEAYGSGVDENRVRLLEGAPDHRNCIRIEVVDLGAHWDPKNGFIPKDVRSIKSATFTVIYAAAQNPEWVRQMNGRDVPYALSGGLELNVPGYDLWARLPDVWHRGGEAGLDGRWIGYQEHEYALPCLWE